MSDTSKRHEPADGHLPSSRELRGCVLGLLVFILVVAGIVIWLLTHAGRGTVFKLPVF